VGIWLHIEVFLMTVQAVLVLLEQVRLLLHDVCLASLVKCVKILHYLL
jgi:hypothetical protein